MRTYRSDEVEEALLEQGYAPVERTGHHVIFAHQADLLVLPAPYADGTYSADELDQIIADRWVPIAPGRLRPTP